MDYLSMLSKEGLFVIKHTNVSWFLRQVFFILLSGKSAHVDWLKERPSSKVKNKFFASQACSTIGKHFYSIKKHFK